MAPISPFLNFITLSKMNNRRFDISSEGRSDFDLAMTLAMSRRDYGRNAYGYLVKDNKMILYWTECDGITLFADPKDARESASFVWDWLEKTKPNFEPLDHDGDNAEGFRIFNEEWGHVNGQWQAFVAIEPIWAWHGK